MTPREVKASLCECCFLLNWCCFVRLHAPLTGVGLLTVMPQTDGRCLTQCIVLALTHTHTHTCRWKGRVPCMCTGSSTMLGVEETQLLLYSSIQVKGGNFFSYRPDFSYFICVNCFFFFFSFGFSLNFIRLGSFLLWHKLTLFDFRKPIVEKMFFL